MGTLLETLPQQGKGVVQSFNFVDIATLTGYLTFYGCKDEDTYKLISNTAYSDRVMTVSTASVSVDTIQHDLDFDLLLNAPINLKGELIACVPVGIRNIAGSAQSYNLYVKIYLRRVRGGVETEIANDTGTTLAWGGTTTANGAQARAMLTVSVTVPFTHYKIGDTLRVTTEVHGWNGGGSSEYYVGHDPRNRATDLLNDVLSGAGRTFGSDPSNMLFFIPVKLDTS